MLTTIFQLAVSARNATTPQTIQVTPTRNKKPGRVGRRPTWPGLSGVERGGRGAGARRCFFGFATRARLVVDAA
jgi:hypothetical protein